VPAHTTTLTTGCVLLQVFTIDFVPRGRPAPITVTDRPFDPAKAGYELGDYPALATRRGAFHPPWNDTRTGELELFTAAVPV
jgi:hypothetical protein